MSWGHLLADCRPGRGGVGGAAVPWQQCGADAEVHFWTPARDAGPPPSQAECVLLGQLPPALLSRGLSRGPLLRRASLGSIAQRQLEEQLPATSPLRKCEAVVSACPGLVPIHKSRHSKCCFGENRRIRLQIELRACRVADRPSLMKMVNPVFVVIMSGSGWRAATLRGSLRPGWSHSHTVCERWRVNSVVGFCVQLWGACLCDLQSLHVHVGGQWLHE